MFTGIVEEIGKICDITRGRHSATLTIEANKVLEDAKIGDSIAVNGICLTVTSLPSGRFTADVMHETMNRTSMGKLRPGDRVGLERAMPVNGRFGGHIVAGHADGTGTIEDIRKDDNAIWYTVRTSSEIMKYIVEKGSGDKGRPVQDGKEIGHGKADAADLEGMDHKPSTSGMVHAAGSRRIDKGPSVLLIPEKDLYKALPGRACDFLHDQIHELCHALFAIVGRRRKIVLKAQSLALRLGKYSESIDADLQVVAELVRLAPHMHKAAALQLPWLEDTTLGPDLCLHCSCGIAQAQRPVGIAVLVVELCYVTCDENAFNYGSKFIDIRYKDSLFHGRPFFCCCKESRISLALRGD